MGKGKGGVSKREPSLTTKTPRGKKNSPMTSRFISEMDFTGETLTEATKKKKSTGKAFFRRGRTKGLVRKKTQKGSYKIGRVAQVPRTCYRLRGKKKSTKSKKAEREGGKAKGPVPKKKNRRKHFGKNQTGWGKKGRKTRDTMGARGTGPRKK